MNSLKFSRFVLLFCVAVLFFNSSKAQYRHYYSRGYQHYYSRPNASVRIGIGSYGYRHYPYYSPGYRVYPPSFRVGYHLNVLPFGFRSIYVGPSPYYYYNGIYYRPYGHAYEIASPPLGAQVPELPRGAEVIVIDGEKYYEYYGTYYKEDITANNEIWYDVVGVHGRLETNNTSQSNIDRQSNENSNENNSIQNQNESSSGSQVDKLPEGCKTVVINHQKYYVSPSGVYYQEVIEKNTTHYEIVGK